ncbi:glycosyltransferase [Bacillus sp. C1-1]|nr:glycosyltransferase [Bacillus sp. C1-1]
MMKYDNDAKEKFFTNLKLYSSNITEKIESLRSYSIEPSQLKQFSLSVIVICKDEERCIERCLNAINRNLGVNDEVIIIDTGSTDHTLNILNKYRAQSNFFIFEKEWNNDFAEIRNFGIHKASKDWIVFIDADETVENDSFANLKSHLSILDLLNVEAVCCPAIVNTGGHVVQTVRRIIPNSQSIFYFGAVHEEPRPDDHSELFYLAFEDIIFHHDGYVEAVSTSKEKQKRNMALLYPMIDKEPMSPRWHYLLCRDGKGALNEDFYRDTLLKVITLCGDDELNKEYKVRAVSDLIEFYLGAGDIDQAANNLEMLKELAPHMTDTLYWDILVQVIIFEYNYHQFIQRIIDYKKNHKELDYGSLNSNGFHLDHLLSRLFFNIREYGSSFAILKKLENAQYGEYKTQYEELHKTLKNFLQAGEGNEK